MTFFLKYSYLHVTYRARSKVSSSHPTAAPDPGRVRVRVSALGNFHLKNHPPQSLPPPSAIKLPPSVPV